MITVNMLLSMPVDNPNFVHRLSTTLVHSLSTGKKDNSSQIFKRLRSVSSIKTKPANNIKALEK